MTTIVKVQEDRENRHCESCEEIKPIPDFAMHNVCHECWDEGARPTKEGVSDEV